MTVRHDAATPTLSVTDPRALVIRNVGYCRHPDKPAIEARITRQTFDATGRVVESWDPRLWDAASKPNLATLYSLSGQALLTDSVDAGWQLSLLDQAGSLRSYWDGRGNQRQSDYDDQQRLVAVTEQAFGESPDVVERCLYADANDAFAQHNQCGQLIRHDDPGGHQLFSDYGLAGALLVESRRFLTELERPDWPLDLNARNEYLEEQSFVTNHRFNPTGELRRQTDAMGNVRAFHHDVAGKPCETWLLQSGTGKKLQCLISDIRYNAYDQIESETAGNGVITLAEYGADDARLLRLVAGVPNQRPLQDLNYVYDPVGNIVELEDKSQAAIHFNSQRIEPINCYRYDSLYQLVEAKGWEVATPSHGPALPGFLHLPLDPNQRRNYTQTFDYDPAGNLTTRHHSGAPGFSMFTSIHSNRSLAQREDGSLPGKSHISLGFDAAGNQLELQRGQAMTWDIRNQLGRVTLVKRESAPDDYQCYVYDRPGHRLQKVSFIQTSGQTLCTEVRYLPGLEIHRACDGDERHVISVDAGRDAVRALHWPHDTRSDHLRYSLSDHLGSCALELDDEAGVLTREHYYPFGGTACWAGKGALVAKYKTIRYSGKERDATGLYYYGYRYYAPWLQRWLNTDPAKSADGLNYFLFVKNDPISHRDPVGLMRRGDAAFNMRKAEDASSDADRASTSLRALSALTTSRREVHSAEKFKALVNVVIARNKELKALGEFVFSANVETPVDRSYFWSGDTIDSTGKVVYSAMMTAQFLARKTRGMTVEMTPGGEKLNVYKNLNYVGSNSTKIGFMYLKERFKYMDSPTARGDLLAGSALRAGVGVKAVLGDKFFDSDENPLNDSERGVAGTLWDVLSIRYARGAKGTVNVIHAASVNDAYFYGDIYSKSTWLTREKVALEAENKTKIFERFHEDLTALQLKGY
ncbi:RHS repeat domain-containing protein [Pseudomonas sp. B21-053]|uniref:RHS repeat domain-containing protein n=1 Tax=Pseudomonas sp. B21-053 TaxID=2895493 RepID=UPI0022302578|nr:RHS repeat-associated core domain-containing protein [Pseudomonas sp. B21-053]UZE12248.1 RHS repeat protein [Pseudomonas sp. B21-053]